MTLKTNIYKFLNFTYFRILLDKYSLLSEVLLAVLYFSFHWYFFFCLYLFIHGTCLFCFNCLRMHMPKPIKPRPDDIDPEYGKYYILFDM